MRRALVAAAAAVSWLSLVPSAHAETPHVVLTVQELFLPGDTTIAQGDSLTLVNLEPSPHDVTSDDVGPGGPLFWSETLYQAGTTAPVHGVPALEPGTWTFYCSVHVNMHGSIKVE